VRSDAIDRLLTRYLDQPVTLVAERRRISSVVEGLLLLE